MASTLCYYNTQSSTLARSVGTGRGSEGDVLSKQTQMTQFGGERERERELTEPGHKEGESTAQVTIDTLFFTTQLS